MDEAYFEKLYSNVNALYRLDQGGGDSLASGKKDLGPLPGEAIALLVTLGVVWLLIALYVVRDAQKKRKNQKKSQ